MSKLPQIKPSPLITWLVCLTLTAVHIYVLGAAGAWTLNIAKWDPIGRTMCAIATLGIAYYLTIKVQQRFNDEENAKGK